MLSNYGGSLARANSSNVQIMFIHVYRYVFGVLVLSHNRFEKLSNKTNIHIYSSNEFELVFTRNTRRLSSKTYCNGIANKPSITEPSVAYRSRLTWNTVTVAHRMLLKCFLSHSHLGWWEMISGQVQSRSVPLSSTNLQNLPPNRYMPRILLVVESM